MGKQNDRSTKQSITQKYKVIKYILQHEWISNHNASWKEPGIY